MARFFKDYHDSHAFALRLARFLGRETGIEVGKEYATKGFYVHHLPRVENRFGFELRCEVVKPSDPFSDRDLAAAAGMKEPIP